MPLWISASDSSGDNAEPVAEGLQLKISALGCVTLNTSPKIIMPPIVRTRVPVSDSAAVTMSVML